MRAITTLIALFLFVLSQAQPVLESYTTADTRGATANNIDLTKPTGVTSGDLLIIIVGNDANEADANFTAPSGWTILSENGSASTDAHSVIMYKTATGSEGSTENVSADNADEMIGWYLRISGANTADPFNATSTISGTDGGVEFTTDTSSFGITGVTTDADNCLVFAVLVVDGGDLAPFSTSGTGWSEHTELTSGTTNGDTAGSLSELTQTTSGTVADCDVTASLSDNGIGFMFAIEPAASSRRVFIIN